MNANELKEVVAQLVAIAIMLYGIMVLVGAPFGVRFRWANNFASWVFRTLRNVIRGLALWILRLPVRIIRASYRRFPEVTVVVITAIITLVAIYCVARHTGII